MDTDLLCVVPRPRCGVWGCRSAGVGPPFTTKLPCASVCLRTDAVASGSQAGSGSSVPGGGASAGSLRRPQAGTPVRPLPAPRARGRGAARRGPRKLAGAPARCDRGRVAGSERVWPRGLAGEPGFRGAGPPLGRDSASSFPSAGARPGPGVRSPHLSRRAGGSGGASREGAAPGVIGPGRGLAPGASRPRSAPGGLARWACPASATERARWGRGAPEDRAGVRCWHAWGPASSGDLGPQLGGDGNARPAPSDPAPGAEWHPPARPPNMVGAEPRPPLPFRPLGRARPRALPAALRRSQCPARPGGRLGAPFQVRRVSVFPRPPSPDAPAAARSQCGGRPRPSPLWRAQGKGAGSPSPAQGQRPGTG